MIRVFFPVKLAVEEGHSLEGARKHNSSCIASSAMLFGAN